MSSDVIVGHDGRPRCVWAGTGDTAFARYHDEVWGHRTYEAPALFEALTLGVFEVGLSWSIVFGKRDAFRKAFLGFDVVRVSAMSERDVERLTRNASIIRNRAKIQATVDNARAMLARRRALQSSRRPTSSRANGHHGPWPTYPRRPRRRKRSPGS